MMRRFLVLLGVVSVAMLTSVSAAQAAVVVNTSAPLDAVITIPCTGDPVHLTGPLHTLVTSTVNNNTVSGSELNQPQGVTGTDLTTGARYQGTGETRSGFSASLINGQVQFTFVNNFKIIGHDAASYLVHETTHLTINANGTVTANVDNLSITCR